MGSLQGYKRVLLVRHAECEMNLHLGSSVGGRSNTSPLTPLGVQQAKALGRGLTTTAMSPTLGPVFASTAVRAVDTAKLMLEAAGRGDTEITVTEEVLEQSQGSWEGKLRSECYTREVMDILAYSAYDFEAPDGGESQRTVEKRMRKFVEQTVLPLITAGGPPALLVSHGMAIKCFLRGVLGSDPGMTRRIWCDNTSVTEVAWCEQGSNQGWHIGRVNDVLHLQCDGFVRWP